MSCIVVGAKTTIRLDPLSLNISPEDTFNVSIYCSPGQPIRGFECRLFFDSSILKVNSIAEGNIFDGYFTYFNPGTIDNNKGTINDIYGFIIGPGEVSTSGTFVTISFTSKNTPGTSRLDINKVGVTNKVGYVSVDVTDGKIIVEHSTSIPPGNYDPPPPENVSSEKYLQNNPPEPPIKPSAPIFIETGVEYEFTSSTVDIDGDQIRYKFDWGDGNMSEWSDFIPSNTSVKITNSWIALGTYKVKVLAQDEKGLNSSWSPPLNVTVSQLHMEGTPPVADFAVHSKIATNQTIFFDASGSFDIDGFIISYFWDFGDGTIGSGIGPTHVYKKPGKYTVTLIITDDKGQKYSKSMIVTVVENTEEQSGQGENALLFDLGMILIGFALASIACFGVLFRDDIKSFVLSHIPDIDLHSYLKIWNVNSRIKRIDEKIKKIVTMRPRVVNYKQFPVFKTTKSSYETPDKYKEMIRSIDVIAKPNHQKELYFDDIDNRWLKGKIDEISDRELNQKKDTELKNKEKGEDLRSLIDMNLEIDGKKFIDVDIGKEKLFDESVEKDIEKMVDDFLVSRLRERIDDLK
jgi:PKD repeat protein